MMNVVYSGDDGEVDLNATRRMVDDLTAERDQWQAYALELEAASKVAKPVIDAARLLYQGATLDDRTGLYCVENYLLERVAKLVAAYDHVPTK